MDDIVQVRVHELERQVDVVPVLDRPLGWSHNVPQIEHVLVVEVLQQPHLTERALAVDGILKGVGDLLDRHRVARHRILGGTDEPIRALANLFLDLVAIVHLKGGPLDLILDLGHLGTLRCFALRLLRRFALAGALRLLVRRRAPGRRDNTQQRSAQGKVVGLSEVE